MNSISPAQAPYKIHLPTFSGPLDLLLHLIERSELDITAISLATVTDQFLQQVEQMREDRLDHLMEFIVIGAKLLVIKSRALLPQLPSEIAEDDEEENPAEALARQLKTYRRFKFTGNWLQRREVEGLRTYLRIANPPRLDGTLALEETDADLLLMALKTALRRATRRQDSVSVAIEQRTLTLHKQMKRLRERINAGERVFFEGLLSDQITLLEISVTLLAVLELIKLNEIKVRQPVMFGPIEIATNLGR
jgi:segregation and condensation protein A